MGHDRIELDTNAVERAMRPIALNRKNALFAGCDEGAEAWACLASLIETCRLNDADPEAYLADVLEKLVNGWPASRIDELLPWAEAYTRPISVGEKISAPHESRQAASPRATEHRLLPPLHACASKGSVREPFLNLPDVLKTMPSRDVCGRSCAVCRYPWLRMHGYVPRVAAYTSESDRLYDILMVVFS